MILNIKYSEKFERDRVRKTLLKSDFFKDNGYRPRLPKGIELGVLCSDDKIRDIIKKEYEEFEYVTICDKIQKEFKHGVVQFDEALKNIFGKNNLKKVNVILTKYGVGGSYNLPNHIIINVINSDMDIILYKYIYHEIVHLFIESNIQKYKILHWEKERVVDLILHSKHFTFINYEWWQNNYHGSEKYIDSLFEEYFFQDIDYFFKQIESKRLNND